MIKIKLLTHSSVMVLLLMVCCAGLSFADSKQDKENYKIYDERGRYEGRVDDGKMYDSRGRYEGRLKESRDGETVKIYDNKGKYKGQVKKF